MRARCDRRWAGNKSLETLNLSSIDFKFSPCVLVAKLIERHASLKVLDLGLCSIGGEGAMRIFNALRSNTCLTTLNLSGVRLDGACSGIDLSKNSTLAVLNLDRCTPGVRAAFEATLGMLGQLNGLASLSLADGRMSDAHVPALAEFIRSSRGLRTLDLSGMDFAAASGAALMDALTAHGSLNAVELTPFNEIIPEVFLANLHAMVEVNPNLITVNPSALRVKSKPPTIKDNDHDSFCARSRRGLRLLTQ